VNPIDTMPTGGEFFARRRDHDGAWFHVWWDSSTPGFRHKGDGKFVTRDMFDAWLPIPTSNHRLVTVEDLIDIMNASLSYASDPLDTDGSKGRRLHAACAKVGLK
jgi:hypothetical protein